MQADPETGAYETRAATSRGKGVWVWKRVVAVYGPPTRPESKPNKNYGDNSRSSNDACEDATRGEAGSWQMEISRSANEASKRGRDLEGWMVQIRSASGPEHWPPGLCTRAYYRGVLA